MKRRRIGLWLYNHSTWTRELWNWLFGLTWTVMTVALSDSYLFREGDVVDTGSERVIITGITGTAITVKRGY